MTARTQAQIESDQKALRAIQVYARNEAGNLRGYPANEASNKLCELLKTKTISKAAMVTLVDFGFTFESMPEKLDL